MSYGPITNMAVELADRLEKERGESVSIISAHTIKPIDREGVAQALLSHKRIIIIEEHVPHGGLGSRVKEIAWDIQASCHLSCFSLKDQFMHFYGSYEELLDQHGLSTQKIFNSIRNDA